jgi:hypothetical protein
MSVAGGAVMVDAPALKFTVARTANRDDGIDEINQSSSAIASL